MVRALNRSEIDDMKWDACISESLTALPYAYSWYLDAVCEDFIGLVFEDYKAVMPLPIKEKLGIKYVYQPFFCQQLGIYSPLEVDMSLSTSLQNAIPETIKYIDYHLNRKMLIDSKKNSTARHTSHLSLDRPYAEISKGYKSNTKRNLKKAANFRIEKSIDINVLIDLFQKNIENSGLGSSDYDRLRILAEKAEQHHIGKSIALYNNDDNNADELAAGCFYLEHRDSIIWLFPVMNRQMQKDFPSFALVDFIIKENAESKIILDFEGSMIEGVQRFYEGFGAKKVAYHHLKVNRLPWYLKWLKS